MKSTMGTKPTPGYELERKIFEFPRDIEKQEHHFTSRRKSELVKIA